MSWLDVLSELIRLGSGFSKELGLGNVHNNVGAENLVGSAIHGWDRLRLTAAFSHPASLQSSDSSADSSLLGHPHSTATTPTSL